MKNEYLFDDELCEQLEDIEYELSSASAESYLHYDKKRISCSFTGHRDISDKEKAELLPRIKSTVLYLVSEGVREFRCGGALGFDTLAASVVYDVSRQHDDIRLILEIPYEAQTKGWGENNKRFYEFLKSNAHEVIIHGKNPSSREQAVSSLLARNRAMIDKSHYCVCYLRDEGLKKGGTAYTVRYAKLHDVQIINLAE